MKDKQNTITNLIWCIIKSVPGWLFEYLEEMYVVPILKV